MLIRLTNHLLTWFFKSINDFIVYRTIAKQMKKYEKQKKRDAEEMKELARAENESKIQKFVEDEKSISSNDAPFQSRHKSNFFNCPH